MDFDSLLKAKAVLEAAAIPAKHRFMTTSVEAVAELKKCSIEEAKKYCEEHGRCIDVVGGLYEFKINQ